MRDDTNISSSQKMSRDGAPRSIEEFSFVGSGSSAADRKDRTSENHDRALADAILPRPKKPT
jgi:hypothetical protein